MKDMKKRIRILIAKPGLDGHDRGAKMLTLGLRDAGMEVIYTGIKQTPEAVVKTALEEDVDVVGLSCLSGAHNYYFPEVVGLLRKNGLDRVMVIGGGIIPEDDIISLKEKGIRAIFGPGSRVEDIANFIKENV
jgi:methylmalonyl-CoA mutase C-terminal domain/subunit